MGRANRLQERFKLIQQTLTELHGRDHAFGAASAAWLMALQYTHRQALLALHRELEPTDRGLVSVNRLEQEMEALLQSFHGELCEHLDVDQARAWDLARMFKEVIHDICHQGG